MESATTASTLQHEIADLHLCVSRREWKIPNISEFISAVEFYKNDDYSDCWIVLRRLSKCSGVVSIVQDIDVDCSVAWFIYPATDKVAPLFICENLYEATKVCVILNLIIFDIHYLSDKEKEQYEPKGE